MSLKWYGEEIQKKTESIAKIKLQAAAHLVEKTAKRLAPVDTGRLRASITTNIIDDFTAKIGSKVKYAAPVEFSQPYLRPALHQSLKKIRRIFGVK